MAIKKGIVLFFFLLTTLSECYGQAAKELSNDEWNAIIKLLGKEQWAPAEKLCTKYMSRYTAKNDDSIATPAILRYMYLRTIAAQLGEKTIDKETALAKTKILIGKTIITPPRKFVPKGVFNTLSISEDGKNLFSCGSNITMTVIQTFETYKMADTTIVSNSDALINKKLRMAGTVDSIETGGVTMPHLAVVFTSSFIWEQE